MTEKKVMNFKDLAAYTGLSESYLYRLTSRGILPGSRPFGKCLFFDKDEIDKILMGNKSLTAEETDRKAETFLSMKKL
jgi:excisionase family DNA binding protein